MKKKVIALSMMNEKIKDKVYTNSDGEHVINSLPKRSKCIIYFEKRTTKKVEVSGLTLNVDLGEAHFDGTACDEVCVLDEIGRC